MPRNRPPGAGWLAAFVVLVLLDGSPLAGQARRVRPDASSRAEFEDQPRIALVVGVAAYPESSDLAPLKYSARDAQFVAEELTKKGYKVKLLLNDAAGTEAVREALEDFADAFPDGDGTVLFYFSGHGIAEANDRKLYLATHGTTSRSVFRSGLPQDEIDQLLQKSRAKRRIMWIDACRNSSAPGSRSAFATPRNPVEFAISQGTRVLYAAESNRLSYEYDELQHGVFTHFLIKGLRGDAAAADGFITFDDLTRYVTANVRDWGTTRGRAQRPYVAGEHSGDFLIAVHTKPSVPAATPAPVATPAAPSPAAALPASSTAVISPTSVAEIRQLHEQERWGESLPMLNRLLTAQPVSAELLALRSHAYSHLGRQAEAVADGEKAVKIGPAVAEAYLRRGEALMSEGKYKESIADFDKSIKLDPGEAEAWGNRGAAQRSLGQHQQAVESFSQGLKVRNDRYDLWMARGASYMELGNHKQGLLDLSEAINLRPRDAVVYYARAGAYVTAKQLEPALKDVNQSLRLEPDNPDALATRGYIYSQLGNREKALEDLRYAVRLRPEMKEVAELLRQIESQGGAPAEAPVSRASNRETSAPPASSMSYARMVDDATGAIRAGRTTEAGELVDEMIRMDPARSEGWTLRGALAINAYDNLPAAYEAYENALARGGAVAFRLAHDHGMDQQPCFGILTLTQIGAEFSGETGGHRFQWPYATIREAAINEFYGSAIGMFHIKAQMSDGSKSFNFAVVRPADQQILNRRPDAEMLLGFINRRKQ